MLPAITLEQVANATGVDPELSELRKYIHRSAIHLPRELAHYRSFINELSVTKEGVVLRDTRIVIPNSLFSMFGATRFTRPTTGHLSSPTVSKRTSNGGGASTEK